MSENCHCCKKPLNLETAVQLPDGKYSDGVSIYLGNAASFYSAFPLWGELFCDCECLAKWIRTIPKLFAEAKEDES